MGVNITCAEGWFEATYDNGSYNFHGDVSPWQSFSETGENKIVYNYDIRGWSNQGIYGEAQASTDAYKMDNLAIVNASIADDSFGTANWSKWERRTNHLLIWHCTLLNHGWEFLRGYDPATGDNMHGRNFSIQNNIITKLSDSSGANAFRLSEYDGAAMGKILVLNNHFIRPESSTTYHEDVPTQNPVTYTYGDSGFVDPANYDLHPSSSSILNNRAAPLVPADAMGVERALDSSGRSAIGAWSPS